MGILKNIVGGAISNGIGSALSKAVEKAVKPAAERFANKQAEAIDNATQRTADTMEKYDAAMDQAQKDLDAAAAGQPVAAAPAPEGAPAEAPVDGAAPQVASQPAQRPLTEEERAQAASAAAALRGFGAMFSGAIAQAKKEEEAAKAARAAAEAAIFTDWEKNLGAYPKWDVGGSNFILEEETPMNGYPSYRLILDGRPFLMEAYAAKLRSAGFIARGCSNPQDLNADTYYKIIDGVCWSWNRTDACMDGQICTSFYVDTPPKAPTPHTSQSGLEGLAKGLFKKILK